MLKAIFYARFHAERGPSVIHQHPINSIIASNNTAQPLITWTNVTSYVIPPYDLCNRPLSVCTESHRVLGFPISIEDAKYERNRFTFNVCLVLAEDEDIRPWEPIVRKTASFFQAVEVEDGLLSSEEASPRLRWAGEPDYPVADVGIVNPLLATILDGLNSYAECSARVDDLHVLNLRLLDHHPSPILPKIHAWDVPVLTRPLPDAREWTWDLTLRRIHPFIDGVRHVGRIGELADAEPRLVRRAVAELVAHSRASILDMFHFAAIYAPTPRLPLFLTSAALLSECRAYVSLSLSSSPPSPSTLITLYTSLSPGLPLSSFALAHGPLLAHVDLRRLITFGLLKGFLRRVHRYLLALDPAPMPDPSSSASASPRPHQTTFLSPSPQTFPSNLNSSPAAFDPHPRIPPQPNPSPSTTTTTTTTTTTSSSLLLAPADPDAAMQAFDRAWRRAALSSGWATPPSGPPAGTSGGGGSLGRRGASVRSAERVRGEEEGKLRGWMDGRRSVDGVCVELRVGERGVMERVKGMAGKGGEVVVFNR